MQSSTVCAHLYEVKLSNIGSMLVELFREHKKHLLLLGVVYKQSSQFSLTLYDLESNVNDHVAKLLFKIFT